MKELFFNLLVYLAIFKKKHPEALTFFACCMSVDVFCVTGSKFSDEEGTSVYTDGACFFNGKHGHVAGIGVFWDVDDSE